MANNDIASNLTARRLEDEKGHDFVRISFPRTDGREPGSVIEPIAILNRSSELRTILENRGCDSNLTKGAVGDEVRARLTDGVLRLATSPGWAEGSSKDLVFALPHKVVGAGDHYVQLSDEDIERCIVGDAGGTLEEWKVHVAMPALASPVAALFILAALAPPLIRFSAVPESFILNVAGNSPIGTSGNSSSGKTTATMTATSVWGHPLRARTWNVSDRAAAELAAANNGLLLVLDDAEKAATARNTRLTRVHDLTHLLTSGQSRDYSVTVGQLGKLRFECVILSSSPWSIEAAMSHVDGRSNGDRARLLEVMIPPATEGGIFADPLWGDLPNDTRDLADALKAAAGQYHGKAGRAWVRYLVSKQSELRERLAELSEHFAHRVRPGASGVEARILSKFGLMYAAGLLAAEADILPWSEKKVRMIAQRGFDSVMVTAFGPQPDDDVPLAGLRDLAQENIARFPTRKQAGTTSSEVYFIEAEQRLYVKSERLKQHLRERCPDQSFSDADVKRLLDRLEATGALEVNKPGQHTRDVRIGPGKHSKWHVFSSKKLSRDIRAAEQRIAKRQTPSH